MTNDLNEGRMADFDDAVCLRDDEPREWPRETDEHDTVHPVEPAPPKRSPKRKPARPKLAPISAKDLLRKTFPEPKFVLPGFIGEGLTILAGAPKVGKSWLALNICAAVVCGGQALGSIDVESGDVLYLSLEDTERRLKTRFSQVLGSDEMKGNLYFSTQCPPLDQAGIDELAEFVGGFGNPRLVIIDVFNKVRPPAFERDNPYEADYRALGPIKDYADNSGVSILLVHHTRKMKAEDPFETISGTNGLTGAADTALVLAKNGSGATLYARGRDVEEINKAIKLDGETGRWTVLGDKADVSRSDQRKSLLLLLEQFPGEALPLPEIVDRSGMEYDNVKKLLSSMKKAGEVDSPKRGMFSLPDKRSRLDETGYTGRDQLCDYEPEDL